MSKLKLTKNEAEILAHRLSFLADEENALDVFEETEHEPVVIATSAARMLALIDSGALSVTLETLTDLAVLDDCIDGCTHLEGAKEEVECGVMTPKQLEAFKRAFYSLKSKIAWLHE